MTATPDGPPAPVTDADVARAICFYNEWEPEGPLLESAEFAVAHGDARALSLRDVLEDFASRRTSTGHGASSGGDGTQTGQYNAPAPESTGHIGGSAPTSADLSEMEARAAKITAETELAEAAVLAYSLADDVDTLIAALRSVNVAAGLPYGSTGETK